MRQLRRIILTLRVRKLISQGRVREIPETIRLDDLMK
jgi:hypothetical protein